MLMVLLFPLGLNDLFFFNSRCQSIFDFFFIFMLQYQPIVSLRFMMIFLIQNFEMRTVITFVRVFVLALPFTA